jgi:hypothetical protein
LDFKHYKMKELIGHKIEILHGSTEYETKARIVGVMGNNIILEILDTTVPKHGAPLRYVVGDIISKPLDFSFRFSDGKQAIRDLKLETILS